MDEPRPTSGPPPAKTTGLKHLVTELRQRNVFKVAVVYGITGWVIVQAVTAVFPAFEFPAWTTQFVIMLVLIGFPITLIIAWAFELTPDGLKKSSEIMAAESLAPETGKTLNRVIIAALCLLLAFVLVERFYFADSSGTTLTDKSIAVLPFDDFGAGGDEAYFADGLTEEILNALSRTPDLLVAARTSSFQYKDQAPDIGVVASSLGVAHILEGSVRRSATRLRITAQLIRASDGFHLWSETYDRQPEDIIEVQEDIAFRIATALQTAMNPEALRDMVHAGTRSVSAYNAYLKGTSLAQSIGGVTTSAAYDFFEEARVLDPEFAAAHARAAAFWLGHLSPNNLRSDTESSELSVEELLKLYHDRINMAIANTSDDRQYLYRAEQAQVNLQFRSALGYLQQYWDRMPNDYAAASSILSLASSLGDKVLVAELIKTMRASPITSAADYRAIVNAYWKTGEYETGREFALEALKKYPFDEFLQLQALRVFLWGGYDDEARQAASAITGTQLAPDAVSLIRLWQACLDKNVTEANRIFASDMKNARQAEIWNALHALGRSAEATEFMRPLDQEGSLIMLSSYWQWPYFDVNEFPNLKRVLDRERITRPAYQPLPFACENKVASGEIPLR